MVQKRSGHRGKRIAQKSRSYNQRAYHAYSREQNGDNGKRVDRRQAEKAEKRGGGSWRLVVSAMILVSVIAVKLVAPQTLEQVRGRLLDLMGKDTDFVAVFSAVGKAVGSDEWNEKLQKMYVAVFGAQSDDGEANTVDEAWCYTPENIPENAHMSQKLLGIAYQQPVSGTVNDKFGYRTHPIDGDGQFHYGIDLQAGEGTVICSFAAGKVTAVGESATLGNYITVLHDGGYQTLYAHCSTITASSGQLVQMGDPIAEVGQTGQATGPHLHFELLLDTLYLNPVYYVAE